MPLIISTELNKVPEIDKSIEKTYSKSAAYSTNRQKNLVRLLSDLQLSQGNAAKKLEIPNRLFRQYCSPIDSAEAPRVVIMALMYLVEVNKSGNT